MMPPTGLMRGLTFIELLLSLALLAGIMLAVAGWTSVSARAGAELAEPIHWRAAATEVLDLIAMDLRTGDLEPVESGLRQSRPPQHPRVTVESGQLLIRTCDQGAATHTYEWIEDEQSLWLVAMRPDHAPIRRLLLQQVADWTCALEVEEWPEPRHRLTITIASEGGQVIKRIFAVEER